MNSSSQVRNLHFECLSGISGDMTLGALIDLGVDREEMELALQSLGLPELRLEVTEVSKCGFRATSIKIEHPEEKAHRHLHHIDAMIDAATGLTDSAKKLAKEIFLCVGVAEAKVHGCDLKKVHFHEVGAIDSIADIVGVAFAIDQLDIGYVSSSPLATGTGQIKIDHGVVAVPAPATAEILSGIPLSACPIEAELTTPTGAAIIKTLAKQFGPAPAMTPLRVGYGAGTKDLPGQANVLRVMMGHLDASAASTTGVQSDRVVLLETNVDDSTAEQLSMVCERLLHAGALDVWQTPCTMKKGRLASVVSVLCGGSKVQTLENILFEQTSTIGIRKQTLDRAKLVREIVTIETQYGPVHGKTVCLPSGDLRFSIEDDEIRRLTQSSGKFADEIRADVLNEWRKSEARGLTS